MNNLSSKALALAAAAAVGCAQIPTPSDPFAPIPTSKISAPTGVRPSLELVQATVPQDPPDQLPPPRPVGPANPPKELSWADGGPTLQELEELADRVNPTLRRDRAQIEAAQGQAVQAGLYPNPRFDTNNPWVLRGRGSLLNVGFQQEIPVMGKKNLDKSAANEKTRQAEITFNENRVALHAAIRQQFYAVLVDQERVRVLTRLSDLARQTAEAVVVRQKAGEANEVDVLTLRVAYQRSQGALASANAILLGDQRQLEAIIGEPGIIRGPVQGRVTGPYPNFDEQEIIKYVTLHHTQIVLAESVLRQNRVLLRRAEVDPYPNPSMGPAYQFGLVPGNDQFWFNLNFTIPAWDRNQGNIRAARANMVAAHESIDVSRLGLLNQAQSLLSQYLAARALVERFEGGVLTDANKAADLLRIAFINRTVDRATLYPVQLAAAQANSDYLDALQNLWLNATQLSGLLQQERFLTLPPAEKPIPVPPAKP